MVISDFSRGECNNFKFKCKYRFADTSKTF